MRHQIPISGNATMQVEDENFSKPWLDSDVVVLLHGLGRSGSFWFDWMPVLGRSFRVLRPDLRGFGGSTGARPSVDIDDFCADVIAMLDELGLSRAHFVGEALGGFIGATLAASFPERVTSLTLVAMPTAPPLAAMEAFSCGYASWSDAVCTLGTAEWVSRTNHIRFPDTADPAFVEWFTATMGATPATWIAAVAECLGRTDIEPLLPLVRCRCLLIYPRPGVVAKEAQPDKFVAGLPEAHLRYLDTEGLLVAYLDGRSCAESVVEFLDESLAPDGRVG